MNTRQGLAAFAEAFYFVRVNFVKLNFILGARCPAHELYWGGLAHNLMEEVGGENGTPHNELYRWFLQDSGHINESNLQCPDFAAAFDKLWEDMVRQRPLEEALAAVAVYEIFDNPDYQMLLSVMNHANISRRGLHFFEVHAKAEHFALFESFYAHASHSASGRLSLEQGGDFVLKAQRKMWKGLLDVCKKYT